MTLLGGVRSAGAGNAQPPPAPIPVWPAAPGTALPAPPAEGFAAARVPAASPQASPQQTTSFVHLVQHASAR